MGKKFQSVVLLVLLSLVAGYLLRSYLLLQPGYEMDINTFLYWSNKITSGGFWSLYVSNYEAGLDYPPLIPWVGNFWLALKYYLPLGEQQIFKLLPTLAELIFSVIAAIFVYRSKSKFTNYLLPIVIVQPALALISTGWGQVDSVLSLFLICGFVMVEKNLYLSTLFMFLALLTKPQAALGVFVLFLIILFRKGLVNFVKQAVFFALLIGAMYLLFQSKDSNFLAVYLLSSSRYPYLSMNAFNFWWLAYGAQAIRTSDTIGKVLSMKTVSFAIFAAFLVPMIYYLHKKAKTIPDYFLAAAYIYLIFFVFPTEIHERYLYPAIALLPFAAVREKKFFWIFIVLSATFLLNNLAVLQSAFPQFNEFAFLQISNPFGQWTQLVSLVNVGVAVYLALYFSYVSIFSKK